MPYVDGFVLCVPKKNLKAYTKLARLGAKVWREHGALEYCECIGDDLKIKGVTSFTSLAKPKAGEVIIFSYIVYKSRSHRDKVNARVMKDPRMGVCMDPGAMPFDVKRMAVGGFQMLIDA